MRKKCTPLPEPRAKKRARVHTVCLSLTELIQLGELKSLYPEKLVQLRGLGKPAGQVICSSLTRFFVSNVNGLPSFVRKCRKRQLVEGSSGRGVTLLHRTIFVMGQV